MIEWQGPGRKWTLSGRDRRVFRGSGRDRFVARFEMVVEGARLNAVLKEGAC
jgi:hypothetical protein